MPIDAGIPLSVRPPQINTPVEAMGQALSLQQLHQQIQQGQALEQERRLKIAQQQRDQAGIEARAAAVKASMTPDPTTGVSRPDYTKAASILNDQGFPEIANGLLDVVTKTAGSRATLQKTLASLQAEGREHLGELAANAKREIAAGTDRTAVRDHILNHVTVAAGDGLIQEGQARQFIEQTKQAPPEAIAQLLDQYITDTIRQREATTRKTNAEASVAEMKAKPPSLAAYQTQIDTAIPPTDKTNAGLRARTIAAVQYARTAEDADKAVDEMRRQLGQIDVAKNTVPYKIAVQTGGMTYGPNAQGEPNPTAKAIAEYRLPPLSSFAMARPGGQMLMAEVTRLNPAYDATLFPQRQKTRIAYTTGTEGQQLNALNTAIMHMDLLAEAAEALKNGDFKPGNRAFNAIKDLFGSATPNNYDTIKEFLDGEVGAVIKKGVATEGEMGRLDKKGGTASSPEQLQGYIKNAVRILGGKAAVLNDKYHTVMGASDPFSAISPRSEAVLVKHGFNPAEFGAPPSANVEVWERGPDGKLRKKPKSE